MTVEGAAPAAEHRIAREPRKPPRDLRWGRLPGWDPGQPVASLERLADAALRFAQEASEWYLREKRGKQRAAMFLRYTAIVFVGLAGIFPLLAQIFGDAAGAEAGARRHLLTSPAWAAVFLGVAGLLVAFDQFGRMSVTWMRFILAHQEIDRRSRQFQVAWFRLGAARGVELTPEQIDAAIEEVRRLLEDVDEVVKIETDEWARDFRRALRRFEMDIHGKRRSEGGPDPEEPPPHPHPREVAAGDGRADPRG